MNIMRNETMIYTVQYLRGLAALLVVLHHIAIKGEQYNTHSFEWLHIGYYGVDLFFLISGFIMCYTTQNKDISFSRFMFARFTRILPLYWLVSIAALAIYLVKPDIVNSSGGETSIWASFTLMPNGDKYLVANGWTLSYEFLFYFIFGFSLFLTKKHKTTIASILIIILMTCHSFTIHSDNNYLMFSTSYLLGEFILGIIAYHILKGKIVNNITAAIMLFTGVSLLIAENIYGVPKALSNIRTIYAGFPMLLIFVGAVSFESLFKTTKNIFLSSFEKLGDSSYSLYMIHPFILSPCAMIAKRLGFIHSQ